MKGKSKDKPVKKTQKKKPQKKALKTPAAKKIVGAKGPKEKKLVAPKGLPVSKTNNKNVIEEKNLKAQEAELSPEASIGWDSLPQTFPSLLRFLIAMAERECVAASSWPLPFGKFLAALPKEICGRDFGYLVMSLSLKPSEIASQCHVDERAIEQGLSRASQKMDDIFSTYCGELYRKLRGQLNKGRSATEAILQPYRLSKVDHRFQNLIGETLHHSLLRL